MPTKKPTPPISPISGRLLPGALPLLGQRLRDARQARGWSQERVAQPEFTKSYASAAGRAKARPWRRPHELMAGRLRTPTRALPARPAPGGEPAPADGRAWDDQVDQIHWALATGQAGAALALLA